MSQELFFGSLGGWGLYHSYLFFPFFKKKKTKNNSYQIHVSSPTNTEQFFFLQVTGVL